MYIVLIAWLYVAVMMAAAEATHPQGTVLGAVVTFLLYGAGPVAIVMYLLGTPARRRARKKAEAAASAGEPDAGGEPAAAGVAPKREEA